MHYNALRAPRLPRKISNTLTCLVPRVVCAHIHPHAHKVKGSSGRRALRSLAGGAAHVPLDRLVDALGHLARNLLEHLVLIGVPLEPQSVDLLSTVGRVELERLDGQSFGSQGGPHPLSLIHI